MSDIRFVIVTEHGTVVCQSDFFNESYYYHSDNMEDIIKEGLHHTETRAEVELEYIKESKDYFEHLEGLNLEKLEIKQALVKMAFKIKE